MTLHQHQEKPGACLSETRPTPRRRATTHDTPPAPGQVSWALSTVSLTLPAPGTRAAGFTWTHNGASGLPRCHGFPGQKPAPLSVACPWGPPASPTRHVPPPATLRDTPFSPHLGCLRGPDPPPKPCLQPRAAPKPPASRLASMCPPSLQEPADKGGSRRAPQEGKESQPRSHEMWFWILTLVILESAQCLPSPGLRSATRKGKVVHLF